MTTSILVCLDRILWLKILLDEQDKLTEWAKESLGDLASKVQMTGKLENQPGMITVWNLGVTRNFLRTQRMQNPDDPELFKPEMIAKISEPTLQLSKSHPGKNRLFFGP